ncbi:MAG: hypothetical protein MZW92_00535 [Comamonadaceae bacterium]|nr:hypothetical protein [Comamonadaceae bacterium]
MRSFVDCDPAPNPRLVLKIAETREELEACFQLAARRLRRQRLHDTRPVRHAGDRSTTRLPTTTTLCATCDGQVVGTLSLIRESAIGFPLQRIFDLERASARKRRQHRRSLGARRASRASRRTGGTVLFPLMKFMYEYCTSLLRHAAPGHRRQSAAYRDVRVAALLPAGCRRTSVENYDFVNGAPAVGATLDLEARARTSCASTTASRPLRRNLHHYFMKRCACPTSRCRSRRFYTTNDPVHDARPDRLFLQQRKTDVFADLSAAQEGAAAPDLRPAASTAPSCRRCRRSRPRATVRQHRRFSVKCPGPASIARRWPTKAIPMEVSEVSRYGFRAAHRPAGATRMPG